MVQLKLAAAAVFLGAVILVFFSRQPAVWTAEAFVVVWFALAFYRQRRTA